MDGGDAGAGAGSGDAAHAADIAKIIQAAGLKA